MRNMNIGVMSHTHAGGYLAEVTKSVIDTVADYEHRKLDLAMIFHHIDRGGINSATNTLEVNKQHVGVRNVEHVIIESSGRFLSIVYFNDRQSFNLFESYIQDTHLT